MPVIRIFLLLLVVGGLGLFAADNLSPLLSVSFLGMNSRALPLAVWIGCAIAAGAITSFLLQLLSSIPRGYSRSSFAEPEEVEEEQPQTRQGTWQNRQTQPPPANNSSQIPYNPPSPPPVTPKNKLASDWEETVGENWDLDEEPRASTRSNPESDRPSYETPQEPKTRSQTGSVYSWSYRESSEPGVGKTDVVYDANYRVITPPSQPTTKPEEEDEDWGFEDDEDFKDEGDSKKKR